MKNERYFSQSPKVLSAIFAIITFIVCGAFFTTPVNDENKLDAYYILELKKLQREVTILSNLCEKKAPLRELKNQFLHVRLNYKKLAVLTEYFNPYETKFLNGPALKRIEEDNPNVIIDPHGFQLIEE